MLGSEMSSLLIIFQWALLWLMIEINVAHKTDSRLMSHRLAASLINKQAWRYCCIIAIDGSKYQVICNRTSHQTVAHCKINLGLILELEHRLQTLISLLIAEPRYHMFGELEKFNIISNRDPSLVRKSSSSSSWLRSAWDTLDYMSIASCLWMLQCNHNHCQTTTATALLSPSLIADIREKHPTESRLFKHRFV